MVVKERQRGRSGVSSGLRRVGIRPAALAGCVLLVLVVGAVYALQSARDLAVWAREMTYTGEHSDFVKALPDAPKHYINAVLNGEEPPGLRLDVKFKHWQKILSKREEALQRGALLTSNADEVPAIVMADDSAHKAKIRLKGDFLDHLSGSHGWSLRIDSKGHFFGMRRFSLNRPKARAYAAGPLFLEYMAREEILAPRHQLVNVTLNGADWGLMELEEHVGTELLESQGRKDGVIGGFNEELAYAHHVANYAGERPGKTTRGPYFSYWTAEFQAYQEAKLKEDPRTASNLALAETLMAQYQEDSLRPADVFDLDQFARYLVATTIWGYQDAQYWENTKLYLNPFTLKFEPIAGDIEVPLQPLSSSDMGHLLLVSGFIGDPAFRAALGRAIPELTSHILEGDVLEQLQRELERVETTLHRSFPILPKLDLSVMRANATLLARYGVAFFPERAGNHDWRPSLDDVYAAHVLVRLYDRPTRQVVINNLLNQAITVDRVFASCADSAPVVAERAEERTAPTPGPIERADNRKILVANSHIASDIGPIAMAGPIGAPAAPAVPQVMSFELASDSVVEATPLGERATRLELSLPPDVTPAACEVEVTTRRPGTAEVRTAKASAPLAYLKGHPLDVAASPESIAAQQRWLRWNAVAQRFEGLPGAWSVDTPVILPAGLHLDAGTTLAFAPGAYLIVQGPLDIAGTPSQPVVLWAQNPARPWKGMYVMAAERPSRWQHVEVRDTAALEDGYLILTGAVTFHHSDVTMTDVVFAGTTAEDALNIVHGQIDLERITLRQARSDAFDCDFCEGRIVHATFADIGGDGLDVSGTKAVIETIEANNVRDKAVSVGEDSELVVIRDLVANDVGTAVASKDRSRTVVEGAVVRTARFAGLMSYVKKPAFGPAQLEATSVVFGEDVAQPALAQLGSMMVLNGTRIQETDLDVEELYREGPMVK